MASPTIERLVAPGAAARAGTEGGMALAPRDREDVVEPSARVAAWFDRRL